MKIHLDTDFGGDTDDSCALAMLLGWPEVEIVGITTSADRDGLRAAYVHHVLRLVGRDDVPVEAGAAASLTTLEVADPVIDDARHWSKDIRPTPSRPGAAFNLLTESIDAGAAVVAIGPYTNLAMLEIVAPGSIREVPITVMGGWIAPPEDGLPKWGPGMDFNVQWDTRAAAILFERALMLTMVPLSPTLKAHIRGSDLERLYTSGALGSLLARQSEAHGAEYGMATLGRVHPGLPDDLLNFQYDPVACAVALGWEGAEVTEMILRPEWEGASLWFQPGQGGRRTRVVTDLDGDRFSNLWIESIEAAQR